MMTIQSTAPAAVTAALSVMLLFSRIVNAAPTSPYEAADEDDSVMNLVKRKPTLQSSDQLSIDHKVPTDALVLVGAGLGLALICLCIAIYNVNTPNVSGSSKVRQERAQAKTELRLKGGGVHTSGSNSPTRVMIEKKRHQSNGTAATDILSTDSHSKLTSDMPPPGRYGPKIATDYPKNSRASRGYNSSQKSYTGKVNPMQSSSMLAVPTLASNAAAAAADNASLPGSSVSSSSHSQSNSHSQAPYQSRRGPLPDPMHSYNSQIQSRRTSSTMGRGVDLKVNRARSYKTRSIHVNPQALETSHRAGPASEMHDPLTGYEVKRYTTDPSESLDSNQRNSSVNALDFFGYGSGGSPIYANRTYTDSGSDSLSHDGADGPSTPSAIPRTKHFSYHYDVEQDGLHSPGLDSALLTTAQHSRYATPSKADRRVWGPNEF